MGLICRAAVTLVCIASCAALAPHHLQKRFSNDVQKLKATMVYDKIFSELKGRRTQTDMTPYACDGCLRNATTGQPLQLRLLFVETKDITENEQAMNAAAERGRNFTCGSCCADPDKAVPECFVAENWNTGWVAKPMMEILERTGAELVALTPANFSKEAKTMAPEDHFYSVCPLEVLIGNVEICVGDFWETMERRIMVPFTTPLDINTFKLVTMAVNQEEFTAVRLLDMFKPFSAGVWGLMIAMFAFMALLMWFCSDDESEEFEADELFPKKRGLLKSLWVSTMGYLAGNQFTSSTWSARLIVIGFSFFLATTVAAYTANLASFMVQQPKEIGMVTSLADIVSRKKTLCTVGAVASMLTEPGIQDRLYIEDSSMGSLFELMRQGTCDAALVGSMEFLLYVQAGTVVYDICTTLEDPNYMGGFYCVAPESTLTRYDLTECQCGDEPPLYDVPPALCPDSCVAPNSKFCDVIEVLDSSVSVGFNYALPIAAWVEPYVSAGIMWSKISGKYAQDYKEQLIATNPPSCPGDSPQGRSVSYELNDAISLRLTFMSGTFFFSSIVMVIGLLSHVVVQVRDRSFSKHDRLSFISPEPATVEESPSNVSEQSKAKAPALKLQTEQSIAGVEKHVGSMGEEFRQLHVELAAALEELVGLRHEQAEAEAQGTGLHFAKSGRVPGASFAVRPEHGGHDEHHHKAQHRRTRR